MPRIRLGEKIAEGGYAHLFSGIAASGQVVVRRLKPEYRFNLCRRRRFRAGIAIRRACGQHPHLVQYLGEGGALLGLPYEVIEFVPGNNLKMLIVKRHPAVLTSQLAILAQVAAALCHLHRLGYLHLDVKPENCLVNPAGASPVVKLSDFDLCLPLGKQTVAKDFGGSPLYLAPEYFEQQEVSVASDIFAFGVLAYHLYTGQMPFPNSTAAVLHDYPLEIKFPPDGGREVPAPVRELITRCLYRAPARRFRTAEDLRAALAALPA